MVSSVLISCLKSVLSLFPTNSLEMFFWFPHVGDVCVQPFSPFYQRDGDIYYTFEKAFKQILTVVLCCEKTGNTFDEAYIYQAL